MQLNTKNKTINVNGVALVIAAIIIDNTVTNLCRLAALKHVTKIEVKKEVEEVEEEES